MPLAERKLLSFVIPVYNEEPNVIRTYRTALQELAPLAERYDFEFVFTDNHSTDRTFELLAEIARTDARVRIFRFSRNFGYQKSIYYGYLQARGDAAIQLDADLEDPPRLVLEFVRLWEEGHRVVYGIRKKRQESWYLSLTRDAFYWLVNVMSRDPLPMGAGDFRLVDRCILEELTKIRDPHIYIRGRIAAMGFRQIGIPYERDARLAGVSKFRVAALFGLALDGITSHSTLPLRLATGFGFLCTIISVLLILVYITAKLLLHVAWPPGFATLVILILFTTGINSCFLGILGEYIAKIHAQLKLEALPSVEAVIDAAVPEPPPASGHSGGPGGRKG